MGRFYVSSTSSYSIPATGPQVTALFQAQQFREGERQKARDHNEVRNGTNGGKKREWIRGLEKNWGGGL